MSLLSDFEYEVFISHAWAGNGRDDTGDRGWALEFRDLLCRELRARLAEPVRVFIDTANLPRNSSFPEELQKAVEQTSVFVGIVTPAYSTAPWCRHEFEHFVGHAAPVSAETFPITERIFKVVTRPIPSEKEPEPLRLAPGYKLWEGEDPGPDYQSYRLPSVALIHNSGSQPSREFSRLAVDLTRFLQQCRERQQKYPRRKIFLASCASGLEDELRRLKEELKNHFVVMREPQPAETEEDFKRSTTQEIGGCFLSVHLLNARYGEIPDGWANSAPEVQLRTAREAVALMQHGVIAWLRPENVGIEQLQQQVVQAVKNELPQPRFEFLDKGIENLESHIQDVLRARATAPAVQFDVDDQEPSKGWVFVQCREDDLNRMEQLRTSLKKDGWGTLHLVYGSKSVPPRELSRARKSHYARALARSLGTVIYYGNADDIWTTNACQYTEDAVARNQHKPVAVIAIDPPEDQRRRIFRYPGFETLPLPNGFSPETVSRIKSRLEALLRRGQPSTDNGGKP